MPNLPFTLRQLEVFEQLAELRSFRATSEVMNVSQATISNQMKALEDQLGFTLIDRPRGKKPTLTLKGEDFLADAVRFREAGLQLASHSCSHENEDEANPSILTVFISQYLFNRVIRPKLGNFLQENTGIRLQISDNHFDMSPMQRISAADHDYIILHDSLSCTLNTNTKFVAKTIAGVFGNRNTFYLSPSASAEEISDLPFVLPPEGSYFENYILTGLQKRGIKPNNVAVRTQHFDVMSDVIASGTAVGHTLEAFFDLKQRYVVTNLFPTPAQGLAMYCRPGCSKLACEAFRDFVISSVLADHAYSPVDG